MNWLTRNYLWVLIGVLVATVLLIVILNIRKVVLKAELNNPNIQPPMKPINSTSYTRLKNEYNKLWVTMTVNPNNGASAVVQTMINNKPRYDAVVAGTTIPWYFIAIVHFLEGGMNFTRHLHNGDPLSGRTVNVPAGRPVNGNGPFTWELSAKDAIIYTELHKWTDWSIAGVLYRLERYNGFGYRRDGRSIFTPYLWSKTNHYTAGKFIADSSFSPTAVSAQIGAAVLIKALIDRGAINSPQIVV